MIRFLFILLFCLRSLCGYSAEFSFNFGTQPDVNNVFKYNIEKNNIYFIIEPGNYLYKHKISIVPTDSTNKIEYGLPVGTTKTDPIYGETEVYKQSFDFEYIASSGTKVEQIEVTIKYQGCSEVGVCFPPVVKKEMVYVNAPSPNNHINQSSSQPQDNIIIKVDTGIKSNKFYIWLSAFSLSIVCFVYLTLQRRSVKAQHHSIKKINIFWGIFIVLSLFLGSWVVAMLSRTLGLFAISSICIVCGTYLQPITEHPHNIDRVKKAIGVLIMTIGIIFLLNVLGLPLAVLDKISF